VEELHPLRVWGFRSGEGAVWGTVDDSEGDREGPRNDATLILQRGWASSSGRSRTYDAQIVLLLLALPKSHQTFRGQCVSVEFKQDFRPLQSDAFHSIFTQFAVVVGAKSGRSGSRSSRLLRPSVTSRLVAKVLRLRRQCLCRPQASVRKTGLEGNAPSLATVDNEPAFQLQQAALAGTCRVSRAGRLLCLPPRPLFSSVSGRRPDDAVFGDPGRLAATNSEITPPASYASTVPFGLAVEPLLP
jgi:hypothetical protein